MSAPVSHSHNVSSDISTIANSTNNPNNTIFYTNNSPVTSNTICANNISASQGASSLPQATTISSTSGNVQPGVISSSTTFSAYRTARSALSSAVPMKLFAAWEVEKTPANCIPRLCSLTVNKLSLTRKFASEVNSLAIAAKMMSSKRTLRSNEINLSHYLQQQQSKQSPSNASGQTFVSNTSHAQPSNAQAQQPQSSSTAASTITATNSSLSGTFSSTSGLLDHSQLPQTPPSSTAPVASSTTATGSGKSSSNQHASTASTKVTVDGTSTSADDWISIDLDLTFALQYPHFLKKNGNQLQILLQRRKRYKNRAMLGFKTLACGFINLTDVLQRSQYMNRELELCENTKDLRKATVVAKIIMTSLKSTPVDAPDVPTSGSHIRNVNDASAMANASNVTGTGGSSFARSIRLKRQNLKNWASGNNHNSTSAVLQFNDSAELDSDEEVCDEFSISEGSDSEVAIGTVAGAMMSPANYEHSSIHKVHEQVDHDTAVGGTSTVVVDGRSSKHRNTRFSSSGLPSGMKWRRSTNKKSSSLIPGDHGSSQRNFKQKFLALLKKFRITDSEASDSEEQGPSEGKSKVKSKRGNSSNTAVLTAAGDGLIDDIMLGNIDDLEFDYEDSDLDSNGDLDDISISSTPRPGLKPFFSSKTTLVDDNASANTTILSCTTGAGSINPSSKPPSGSKGSHHQANSKAATNPSGPGHC